MIIQKEAIERIQNSNQTLFTLREIREILGVSDAWIWRKMKSGCLVGQVDPTRGGKNKHYLIKKSDLINFSTGEEKNC